jgi:hypothetical protein
MDLFPKARLPAGGIDLFQIASCGPEIDIQQRRSQIDDEGGAGHGQTG